MRKLAIQRRQNQCRTRTSIDNQTNQTTESSVADESKHLEKLYIQGRDRQKSSEKLRDKLYKEQGYSFVPRTNSSQKYQFAQENKGVVARNQDFITKKQEHIKELEKQTACDFRPQRITTSSKLSSQFSQVNSNRDENWGNKLYEKGMQIEQKREKIR